MCWFKKILKKNKNEENATFMPVVDKKECAENNTTPFRLTKKQIEKMDQIEDDCNFYDVE